MAEEEPYFPPPPSRDPYPDYDEAQAKSAPWKYAGYRLYSKWVASEDTFFIVRRFGALNTRIILALQDEIVQLEHELNRLDEEKSRRHLPDDTNNGSFRFDPFDERRELVQTILPEKLARYTSFVNNYSQLVNRPPVYAGDLETVKKWLKNNHPGSIHKPERAYIDQDDDLIPVQPKIRQSKFRSLFRNFLEKSGVFNQWGFMEKLFRRKPHGFYDIEKEDGTYWQNESKIETYASVVISVIGLVMLISPIWILEYVQGTAGRLGIITGFISVFFMTVIFLTTAQVFDALVAAAAYSAVLVVFLQLGPNSGV